MPFAKLRRCLILLLALFVALYAVEATLAVPAFVDLWGWSYVVIETLALAIVLLRLTVPGERAAWAWVAAGVFAFIAGDVYYKLALSGDADIPYPSWADLGYLLFAPCVYVGLAVLLRRRAQSLPRVLLLDGAVGALAVAALGAAVLFDRIMTDTGGSAATVAVNLAYPLSDLLLMGLVVGVLIVTGWHPGRTWALAGLGLATFAVIDTAYLYLVATDQYRDGTLLDLGWPLGLTLIALSAWQPSRRFDAVRLGAGWSVMAVPALSGLAALALLVIDHFDRLGTVAIILATACLGAVIARLVFAYADQMQLLRSVQVHAVTDALTGLPNRRALTRDLAEAFRDPRGGRTLAMFDLDGFKHYNDTFGHQAGDALLTRLASRLAATVVGDGSAYRMGGDEFCVLLAKGGDARIAAATAALTDCGDGFRVGCSTGVVHLPSEAGDAEEALRVADQRMYADKRDGRVPAARQTENALLRALSERNGELGRHGDDVRDLAVLTARGLALGAATVERVRQVAELHDIGKVAIPDGVLNKRGPLDEHEWAFMRRHTVIGEQILGAAADLQPIAKLVRSTHERWDGTGYPDGLAGTAIPVEARIVLACDAFDAMTTDRPYRTAMPVDEAIAELRSCAGSQFDPAVVAALCRVVASVPAAA